MFNKLKDGACISGNESPLDSGGLHDTFKVDVTGQIYDFHTTVELDGGKKIRLNVDTEVKEIQTTLRDFTK